MLQTSEANVKSTAVSARAPQPRAAAPSGKLDPARAWRALRQLLEDPDDTSRVFVIIDALSGRSPHRALSRLRRRADGRRLLRERPDVLSVLSDRKRLEGMPEGSLGRAYLSFLDAEGITAQGLVAASDVPSESGALDDDDVAYLHARLRDSHDLWHVVTGYHGDLIGEASLLAFSFAQTWSPGVGFIVVGGLLRIGAGEARGVIVEGFRRGLRAEWLPAVHWEALLPLPLDEVRRQLKVGAPPNYEPFRSSELREGGLFSVPEIRRERELD